MWDGTSRTRPDPNVQRAPDGYDWARIVYEVQSKNFELTGHDTILIGNIVDSEIKLADSANNNIIGIAISDGFPGTLIRIKAAGVVERSDWTPITGTLDLIPGKDYFLTVVGMISISPPTIGWSHKVGYALTTTEFVFLKQVSVKL